MTGFPFDEVQVVSLEDDRKDMVPMSLDEHSSTLVLSMMKGMSYMPGLGLGRRQQGSREFAFTIDHDIPYGLLGYGQNIQSSWNINAAEFKIFIP